MPTEDRSPVGESNIVDRERDQHGDVGEHQLPHESLAPITLAVGIGLLGFGLLTSLVFSIAGLVTMAWALMSWIEEMRHE